LITRLTEQSKVERQKLTDFKRKITNDPKAVMHQWDNSFYGNIYKQQNFHIDEDKIKEYFPAENVKLATMDIYQELLGLDFKQLPEAQTWHKEVSCFEVRDKASKDLLGHFYLDLYPRDDKFNHAAAFTLLKRSNING
jgi:neurolysin